MDYQEIDTLSGHWLMAVPPGVIFDKTGLVIWRKLTELSLEIEKDNYSAKRDRMVAVGKRYILSVCLANVHGMASPYWIDVSKKLMHEPRLPVDQCSEMQHNVNHIHAGTIRADYD